MKKKDTAMKTESVDVPLPIPIELNGIITALAEYYDEDYEHFAVWLMKEQTRALLTNYDEMGEMISKYLQRKHDFSAMGDEAQ